MLTLFPYMQTCRNKYLTTFQSFIEQEQGWIKLFTEGGFTIWQKKIFYINFKGVEGSIAGKFLISKGFLMQSKAHWALFLTQYITKS